MSLPVDTHRRLRETLMRCGPFDSNGELRQLFVDSRLSPWRHTVPGAGSRAGRVDALIAFLVDRENVAGEKALALLVQVLAEREPGTGCQRDLLALAAALRGDAPAGEGTEVSGDTLAHLTRQRLQTLAGHIEDDLTLLEEYEEDLRLTTDPRERLRIEREIRRQKEALAGYRQEMIELREAGDGDTIRTGGGAHVEGNVDTGGGDFIGRDQVVHVHGAGPEAFARVDDKLDALSRQLGQMEEKLVAEHAATRQTTAGQTQAILARVDERHENTVALLLQRLDEQQLETVTLLLDAADREEVARWEGEQLLLLVQQALADLERLRRDQPDAQQWESLLAALQQEAAWQQKLKLTIPLVPGLLEFESEAAIDVWEPLHAAWERLRTRIAGS